LIFDEVFEIAFTPFVADTVMTDPATVLKQEWFQERKTLIIQSIYSNPNFKGNRVVPNLLYSVARSWHEIGSFLEKAKRIFEKLTMKFIRFYSCPCSHRSVRFGGFLDFLMLSILWTPLLILKNLAGFYPKRLIDPFTDEPTKEFKKIITTHKFSSLIEYLKF